MTSFHIIARHALLAGTAMASLTCNPVLHAQENAEADQEAAADADTQSGDGQPEDGQGDQPSDNLIIVTGEATTFNSNVTNEPMALQQSALTNILDRIDNLPGVSIQQGDAFGFDDWSTTIAVRGFQNSIDEAQVGITIDGLPNGGSNYGGGSKANRFIDSQNAGNIEVSQGTADIGSLSNEALGGTLNFTSSNPLDERNIRVSASAGEYDALRFYARVDTGDLGGIKAWFSASHQEATDWVNGAAENRRDHFAAKFTTTGAFKLSGYFSYDDAHEDNYQRLYSEADYEADPKSDRLTADWTGIPYIDQLYRRAWSTHRENTFAWLKAEYEPTYGLNLKAAGYYHHLKGRGDWVPPYIVDVTDDGAGNPHSELAGGEPVAGGGPLGRLYYVDSQGRTLIPNTGCQSSFTSHIYGPGPTVEIDGQRTSLADPACYPAGAVGVQSYRHTHYQKNRYGGTLSFDWLAEFASGENNLRGGIWYEDGDRDEYRDWHKITDTRVGPAFDEPAYWTQFSLTYPQRTFKWWIQDSLSFGPVTANFGIKQFHNDLRREDHFDASSNAEIDSTSDVLFSGGLQFDATDSLNLFVGYAENFKALNDLILERVDADLDTLEPETSKNWEAGIRFNNGPIQATATYFNSKFDNRIIFLSAETDAGPDYLIGGSGSFFNAGGIDSQGIELLANARINDNLSLYASYTYIDAEYNGTGDDLVDAGLGVVPGNQVAGIAKNLFVISADYRSGPLRLGVSGKYTDDRFVDIGNSFEADGYFLTDAYLNVQGEGISDMLKNVELGLTVNNLFGADYLGGISGGGAWIGAPRSFVLTATMDF